MLIIWSLTETWANNKITEKTTLTKGIFQDLHFESARGFSDCDQLGFLSCNAFRESLHGSLDSAAPEMWRGGKGCKSQLLLVSPSP